MPTSPSRLRFPNLVLAAVIPLAVAWWSLLPAAQKAPQDPAADEAEIHLAPDAKTPGKPAIADASKSATIQLTVHDESQRPVFCRVNIVGSDGNYYEPEGHTLAPWSLHKLGNRVGKGPFRYYGWFFYSDGSDEITVPPGTTRVEVWKGFEFAPVTATVDVATGKTESVSITLKRTVDMAARGWYSGDTHIHLDRRNETDDFRALDLAAAEDIRFAHILCMNDPRTYQPVMDQQIWHQLQGLGQKSERRRGIYQIASGQEYRCGTYGHICLIGGSRLVDADGLKTDPNNWPVFGHVADELHGIGGYAFHAHGGYEKEIYADYVQQATDGVELLQFAEYRGIGLEGWYHILNAGFRFPAVGASDYPYCRALGDCRTYVYISEDATFERWNKAAAAGQSFFTTGPLLELTVNDQLPGDTVKLGAPNQQLAIRVRLQSNVGLPDEIELIEGGVIRERRKLTPEELNKPIIWDTELAVNRSTWIAVRAHAKSGRGREDVEAHTNPVYIQLGTQPARQPASLRWLLAKLEERIATNAARDFPQKKEVLEYFEKSRGVLRGMLAQSEEQLHLK